MKTFKILAYVIVLSFLFVNIWSNCERYWKRFYFNNTRIVGSYNTVQVRDVQGCVETCVNSTNCNSVGVSIINDMIECYLYPFKVYSGMGTTSNGWWNDSMIYYIPMKPAEEIPFDYDCFYNESFCYKFYSSITLSWVGSASICEEDGGSLFLANSQFKLNLIHQNLVNHFGIVLALEKFVHLGATDINSEGTWNWFNGDPVNYNFFLPNRPDNFQNDQHCMSYRIHNASFSGLDDKTCNEIGNFICEIILKDG